VIRRSLAGLQAALKGQLLMSTELEAVGAAMWDGNVPAAWLAASYPSLKPLASYIADLVLIVQPGTPMPFSLLLPTYNIGTEGEVT
jgi:Dynein heavy chain C-terminal domain